MRPAPPAVRPRVSPVFPRCREIEPSDPLDLMPALSALGAPFLLHSTLEDARGRWTLFGADPFERFHDDYPRAVARWRALRALAVGEEPPPVEAPFTGGMVGHWCYELAWQLERLPPLPADAVHVPAFAVGCYDVVGAFDHASRRAWLFSSGLPESGSGRAARAERRLDEFTRALERRVPAGEPPPIGGERVARSTFDRAGYGRAVRRVQDHIARGDLYQANLSQRWSLPLASGGDVLALRSMALHRALVERSPAPFAAWLVPGEHAVVSASPERFLELRSGVVETRPIKGTRPRGADPESDRALAAELLASEKDRAENVMIVDVLRNDLGRVCETGTVETPALCELEAFPQVFHLTSTVRGRLRKDRDALDLLHACFPGGSITGAPKLRAIEILSGLEPVRRHVYTGCIGYVDWRGDADWSIAIRTALLEPRGLHVWAGGGITADSDPDAEYEETLHKVSGLAQALGRGFGVTLSGAEALA